MATISTLAVNLIARTSVFEKGMRRGKTSTRSFKNAASKATASVARFARGLLIAAGVGGMTFFIKSTLASLDAVSKLSRRIGVTTEALLGLRHAAELAGVSAQSLDKSLEIFVRRMGEVMTGSGEAKKGLELLGLTAEQMIKKTPNQSLLVIADRIQNLGTQAEKSAAAYFLFGRSGAQLLNMFEQGSEGIAKAQKEAELLGITLKGIDLRQVEDANDAMLKFKKSISSVFSVLTIKLTPAIKKMSEFLIRNREAIISATKKMVIFGAKTFIAVNTIKLVAGAVVLLTKSFKSLSIAKTILLSLAGPAGWAAIAVGAAIATGAIIGINEAIDGTIKKVTEFGAATKKVEAKAESFATEAAARAELLKTERSISFWRKKLIDRGGEEALNGDVVLRQMTTKAKKLKEQLVLMQKQKKEQDIVVAREEKRTSTLSLIDSKIKVQESKLGIDRSGKLDRFVQARLGRTPSESGGINTEDRRLATETLQELKRIRESVAENTRKF